MYKYVDSYLFFLPAPRYLALLKAVKDSEKRSSLANTLRDTLTRLDTQHRQKAREQQVTCCVDSDDGQDGARVPETSISVRSVQNHSWEVRVLTLLFPPTSLSCGAE